MKKIVLATPRGFCAGVDRAIHVVEKAIEKFGTPIYVRHEIVHNKFVVETLKDKGTSKLFKGKIEKLLLAIRETASRWERNGMLLRAIKKCAPR